MNITSLPLDTDQLRKAAPAVYAAAPMLGVSSRYRFAATSEILDVLRSDGWEPVRAQQHRVRLDTREGFQTHVVRLARRDDLTQAFEVQTVRPELVLTNSHDRTSAFHLDAGLFRKVCANGLVVADSMFERVAIRHASVTPDAFVNASQRLCTEMPAVLATVGRWQAVNTSEAARTEFARRAIELRWPAEGEAPDGLKASDLLTTRRYGDKATDLWTVFNVVQENLTRGVRYRDGYQRRSVRAVRSPTGEISLNKALWRLAGEFGQN